MNVLKKNFPDRVHIIGSVGSGKTTLARTLSKQYDIPYFELDNVVWKRHISSDIRRTDDERDTYLNEIISTKKWIVEGAHNHKWVTKSFNNADLIIFLDTPYLVRIYRIIKRYVRQLLGIEPANYTPSFKLFMKMFRWNKAFEKENKPQILSMLQQDTIKSIVLVDNREIDKYFS